MSDDIRKMSWDKLAEKNTKLKAERNKLKAEVKRLVEENRYLRAIIIANNLQGDLPIDKNNAGTR